MIGAEDGGIGVAAYYLAEMFEGMGDKVSRNVQADGAEVLQEGLRIVRGLTADEAAIVLDCWSELWRGAMNAQRELKTLTWAQDGDSVTWQIGRY